MVIIQINIILPNEIKFFFFFGGGIFLKDEPYKLLIRGLKNVKCMQNKWIMFRAEKQVSDLVKC